MTLAEVKRTMGKRVTYDGDEYFLRACRMFLDPVRFEFGYSAEIVSVKTNTVICAPLNKITAVT